MACLLHLHRQGHGVHNENLFSMCPLNMVRLHLCCVGHSWYREDGMEFFQAEFVAEYGVVLSLACPVTHPQRIYCIVFLLR